MSLYVAGFYTAKWTAAIEDEWTRNLLANRHDLTKEQLNNTCLQMHRVVRDWVVLNYESLIEGLVLPDANDRHVLASAIRGHADCIVTLNSKDFPADYLATFDLETIHPDDFSLLQLDLHEVNALKAFKAMRMRLKTPAMTPDIFVAKLRQAGLIRTAERLAGDLELL